MPGIYAHNKLGKEVLMHLPEKNKKDITLHRELYDVGLHGPDLLFYYKPMFMTTPGCTGHGTHRMNGIDFFERSAKAVLKADKPEDARAYLYGTICHFALDSLCHPYIEKRVREGVPHTKTESSFERYLLEEDGFNPTKQKLCGHIKVNLDDAAVIASFYSYIKPKQIVKAARSMVFYNGLIRAPGKIKRGAILGLLKLSGSYKETHGMLITKKQSKKCVESDLHIKELFDRAAALSVSLISEIDEHMATGKPLGDGFDHTFGED